MKAKRMMAMVATVALAFSLTGCGGNGSKTADKAETGGGDGKSVTLHMGGGLTPASPEYTALQEFADAVNKETDGTVTISLDLAGALGSGREIIEGVMNGSIDMVIDADITYGTVIPELGFINLPYLFPTREDAEKYYLNGKLGEIYEGVLEENNLTVLGQPFESDFRCISNSKHPIQKPEDLQGLKIRVIESPMYINFFQNLGMNPVGMSISEVAAALQQKVIDGQDNGPRNTYFYGFYEFQKYYTLTNHAYAADMLCINNDVLASLSEDQQKVIKEQADIYTKKAYEYQMDALDKFCKEMEESGMEILDTTDELDAFMREAAKKVWNDDSITSTFNQEAMEFIHENLEQ